MNNKIVWIVCALILGIGFFGAGLSIGKGFYLARFLNRTITVKGLTERDVKSDLGIWEINYREMGNTLTDLYQRLQKDQNQVVDFLKKHGFKSEELAIQPLRLEDKLANAYQTNNNQSLINPRYILTGGIRIRSEQVNLIQETNQGLGSLLEQGISLVDLGNINPNPSYYYTKLDSIRPSMLADAIKSAKSVADQFSHNANTQITGIERANQGIFQVMGRDTSTLSADWSSTQSALGSIDKKIRLVTTIEYRIK